jgi:LuxR family transcriptional regulator, maltose regulon positive regulatory protein
MPHTDHHPPLAEAKLCAPRQRAETLQRPRLLHALQGGGSVALTLVSAPPGYGKTTAVRAWCASRGASPVWVTLDAGDNDPSRLWRYVATAVDRVRGGLGRGALQRLGTPGDTVETAIDELANAIASFGEELVVVLDDVHAVTDPDCLASLDYFVEQLPETARLVLITRKDPALRLARLRARRALLEVRADDLAFTSEEVRSLLEREGLALDARDVESLRLRAEGWPAALVLAAIWLRSVGDPARAIREFGGNQRFVAEYLTQEVLQSLDPATRGFLLRASVLGRFTAELCDAVLDRSDSAAVVAELERANLFVTRLEQGSWYRIHSLFAEFAGFQLSALEPGATVEIHRRAADWLYAQGSPVEAAGHAAQAGEYGLVARLLAEYHLLLIGTGGAMTLLHWVREIPDEQLLEYPELAVGAATATTMLGRSALERRRLLDVADRAKQRFPDRCGPYVEAVAAMVRAAALDGDVDRAVLAGRRAVELAEAAADDALVAALAAYAHALYFAGELDSAWAAALRAVEHPEAERRPPGHAFARSTLALVAADQGRLASARTHAEQARSILGGVGSRRSWLGAQASAALGLVRAGEGRLAEAERELASAERLFRDEVATVHQAWILLQLARIRCRRGRLDEAEAAAREAREVMDELSGSNPVAALAAQVERELGEAQIRAGRGELLTSPSGAELAVLRLLDSDMTVRTIAGNLYLSPNTVRSHTRALYRKLGVNTRADAVARAETLGLLEQTQSSM